ncbi:MAG: ABC transporter ATP-binding protein [Candidatus Eisenbacteria bacterium]|uniref:ABC transporter ATP-binding protein n=1 Tax=Eiseniibacteriota bacterium TaxID=2212470 RepID=A0A938BPM8_UNCEI|nr:ABC transporter ATP-binding protein [Candidatus Eisenbacteria bacterium]
MTAAHFEDERLSDGERQVGSRRALLGLLPLLRRHRAELLLCLGLLIATTLFSLAWPWLIQRAIDGPIGAQLALPAAERGYGALLGLGLAVLAIQGASIVLQYIQRVKLERVGQEALFDLRTRLFRHILGLDVGFFDRNPVGRLMARVESDTEALRMLFTNTVVLLVGDLVLVVGIWGVMFWKHPRLALVLALLTPVLALLVLAFHRMTTHRFLEVRKRMAEVTATVAEFLQGMSIVQLFHRGEYARDRVRRANRAKFDEDAFVNVAVCVFFNLLGFVNYVKIGLVLLLGAHWGLTPGLIVLFILLIWKEFDPVARLAEQLGSFQKGIAGARRIFALLSVEPALREPAEPRPWPGLVRGIRFEGVWFSYTNDERWVLRDVSFEIPVGRRVALAGITGGGKTTIISLLLRFYDPQRGRITIDGVDIRELRAADLRGRFALVLQDIILFPGDIGGNISLGAEGIGEERVAAAARTVDADGFIRRLPDGYGTRVSERGANFSRGERQLLSFARALVVDPQVLILDEATSSIDPETERVIQASLAKLIGRRTSLIIAHRLATIRDADEILVLRDGEIVERGNHAQLLARDDYYARLFRLQFQGQAPAPSGEAVAHVR